MDSLFPFVGLTGLLFAFGIAFCAGFVKGVVGFAMPLVMLTGLTLFLPPELALAGLIMPTLLTNVLQSLRQGRKAAWESIKAYRLFLISGGITLIIAAQMVQVVPERALLFIMGLPAFVYAALQLAGVAFRMVRRTRFSDITIGGFAGIMGGFAGVWGPPTVMYLTALGTPKADQMRVQGVIYGMGAVALVVAHFGSGVLRGDTALFSTALVLPALFGMWFGGRVADRIEQDTFKRVTLIVLLIAGANLLRRALL